jgi:outer membrane receptor protein involved in Fe transport
VRSASTALVNARVGYNVSKTVKLQLDGHNLLNRQNNDIDYYYPSRLANEAAAQADVHFHPVEKRALRLSMTVNY